MKKWNFLIALLVFALIVAPACQISFGNQARGSGKIISQNRPVQGFERVSLSSIGELTITQGGEDSLVIEADDNLVALIDSQVRDGTLYIGLKGGGATDIRPSRPIQYKVTLKELSGVELMGAGNVTIEAVETQTFDLQSSGAGNVHIRSIQADLLAVLMDGAGNCKIDEGIVERQKLEINGSGSYDAPGLESKSADVQISGAGEARLWVSESLDVVILGAGNVSYYGSPEVQYESEGAGELKALGEK